MVLEEKVHRGPEAAVSSVPWPLGTGHAEQTSRSWGVRGLQDTGGAARQSSRSEHNTAQASCLHSRAGTPPGVPEPGDGLRTLPPSAPAACSEITFWRMRQVLSRKGVLENQEHTSQWGEEDPTRKLLNWQYGIDITRFLEAGLTHSGPGTREKEWACQSLQSWRPYPRGRLLTRPCDKLVSASPQNSQALHPTGLGVDGASKEGMKVKWGYKGEGPDPVFIREQPALCTEA